MYYMDNNKTVGRENYAHLLQQLRILLNQSLPEIRKKYVSYPYCLINYFEEGIEKKSIEIRFDWKKMTITCTFNDDGQCVFVHLYPDKKDFTEEFISFLNETSDYDFTKSRWEMSGYYITVSEVSYLLNDICLVFYI